MLWLTMDQRTAACVMLTMLTQGVFGLTPGEELRKLLFDTNEYDPDAGPEVETGKSAVEISLQFTLQSLHSLNEKNQQLTTFGWITATWKDSRLTWDPANYSGIEEIQVSPTKVWTPELTIINAYVKKEGDSNPTKKRCSALVPCGSKKSQKNKRNQNQIFTGAQNQYQDFTFYLVTITKDGSLFWKPASLLETNCRVDVTMYPYDYQTCRIKIGSWSYPTTTQRILNSTDVIDMTNYERNGAWDMLETKARKHVYYKDPKTQEEFEAVSFCMVLERMHFFYSIHLVWPAIAMAMLVPMLFVTPAASGEKIALGVSVLLAFSVFLLFAVDKLPENSSNLPIMGVCMMIVMFMAALSLCLSIINLTIYHKPTHKSIPPKLQYVVLDVIGRFLRMGTELRPSTPRPSQVDTKKHVGNGDTKQQVQAYSESNEKNRDDGIPEIGDENPRAGGGGPIRLGMVAHSAIEHKSKRDWYTIARVIDRLCYVICVVVMGFMFLILLFVVNTQGIPSC